MTSPSLRSVTRTPSQLHSTQQIPTPPGKQTAHNPYSLTICNTNNYILRICSKSYFDIILKKYHLFTDMLPQQLFLQKQTKS